MPLRFRVHSVACAIGCADASIPTREGQRTLSRRVIAGATANEHDRRHASVTSPRSTPLATPVDLRRAAQYERRRAGVRGSTRAIATRSDGCRPGARSSADCRSSSPARRPSAAGSCSTARWSSTCGATGPASHVVVAHFCDAWRDPVAGRPADLPIGWVTPVGQPLARYTRRAGLRAVASRGVMRRRFEVNEGIIGWGQGAFAARARTTIDTPLDWRGPYPAMPAGGYAEPGHAGLLGILPGSLGSGPDRAWPIRCPVRPATSRCGSMRSRSRTAPGDLARLRMEPLAPLDEGGGVVVAAVTAFRGTASPLVARAAATRSGSSGAAERRGRRRGPRPGVPGAPGTAARSRRIGGPSRAVTGWGTPLADRRAKHGDARRPRDDRRTPRSPSATSVVPAQPPARRRRAQAVRRRDHRIAADADAPGRRRDRRCDDRGGDARPRPVPGGRRAVPPAARASRRDQPGPQRGHRRGPRPRRRDLRVRPGPVPDRAAGRGRAGRGGPRVRLPPAHPVASTSAPTRDARSRPARPAARAGRRPGRPRLDRGRLPRPLHLADLGAAPGPGRGRRHRQPAGDAMGRPPHERRRPAGRRRRRPDGPAHGGHGQREPAEHARPHRPAGRLGRGPADGERRSSRGPPGRPADRPDRRLGGCRPRAGRAGPRRPLPAAVRGGRRRHRLGQDRRGRDAGPHARTSTGRRSASGTASSTAATGCRSSGARTRCRPRSRSGPSGPTPAWTPARRSRSRPGRTAVRAGRTFVSSGSFVDLEVDGCGPGDVIKLGRGGGSVEVRAAASAAQPVIDRLELIHDGVVVAATSADGGRSREPLGARHGLEGRLARRPGHQPRADPLGLRHEHGRPQLPGLRGRPRQAGLRADDAAAIGTIIDGARTWVEQIATVRSPAERARLAAYMAASRETLDELVRERSRH